MSRQGHSCALTTENTKPLTVLVCTKTLKKMFTLKNQRQVYGKQLLGKLVLQHLVTSCTGKQTVLCYFLGERWSRT